MKMNLEEQPLIREMKVNGSVNNEYYTQCEFINKEKLIKDCYISSDIVSCNDLGEDCEDLQFYEGFYFIIVEAFNKTYVALNTLGDTPNVVFKDKDGEVLCAYCKNPSIDLSSECYYVGDESTVLGKEDPYGSTSSWLWNSLEFSPDVKLTSLSPETMKELLEVRKEDIQKLVKEAL